MNIMVVQTRGDSTGLIEDLISTLVKAKEQGATHYNMRWSNDSVWAFKWFELYYEKSFEDILQELPQRNESK